MRVQWRQNVLWNHIEIANVIFNVRNLQLNVGIQPKTYHNLSSILLSAFIHCVICCAKYSTQISAIKIWDPNRTKQQLSQDNTRVT